MSSEEVSSIPPDYKALDGAVEAIQIKNLHKNVGQLHVPHGRVAPDQGRRLIAIGAPRSHLLKPLLRNVAQARCWKQKRIRKTSLGMGEP